VPPHLREHPHCGRGQREGDPSYLGHASIQTTFDFNGHLMPGNEDEPLALVDAYLERANSEKRLAHID